MQEINGLLFDGCRAYKYQLAYSINVMEIDEFEEHYLIWHILLCATPWDANSFALTTYFWSVIINDAEFRRDV